MRVVVKNWTVLLLAGLLLFTILACNDRKPQLAAKLESTAEPEDIVEPIYNERPTSGKCGENLTWEFDQGTSTLTISGQGDMDDYQYSYRSFGEGYWRDQNPTRGEPPWHWYYEIDKVIICEGVTSVGDGAFRNMQMQISAVSLPESLIKIGIQAFQGNEMEEITIPKNVREIGDGGIDIHKANRITVDSGNANFIVMDGVLFSADMTRLLKYPDTKTQSEYAIPESVLTLDRGAFHMNPYLESVHLPEGITRISEVCFSNCTALKNVELNKGLVSIGSMAFYLCDVLTQIKLPGTIRDIDGAFGNMGLIELVIPEGIVDASEWGGRMGNLIKITLPTTLREADSRLFSGYDILEAHFMGLPPKTTNIWLVWKPQEFILYYPSIYSAYWCPNGEEYWQSEGTTDSDKCRAIPFESLRGDANCDGIVDEADAILIMQALVDPTVLTPLGALQADTTGKGYYDVYDAINVLRFVEKMKSPAGVVN
ncbi:MAG: leucine-rich repeat protein [Clostridiales bacterium]|nr:leucine-rich repeat protein [Clostridiales bacterium]